MQSDDLNALVHAALSHVVFDGWTPTCFERAIVDSGVTPTVARGICPRGAVDLAIAFHKMGDQDMRVAYGALDTSGMKIREKVTQAVRLRLNVIQPHKEEVRRATTLFAQPHLAQTGARLIWGTADVIWMALGDTSRDGNWYSKRATLGAVYASTVLYWLGDDSANHSATLDFLDRRIENVMQFEKFKAKPALKGGIDAILGALKAPDVAAGAKYPGQFG